MKKNNKDPHEACGQDRRSGDRINIHHKDRQPPRRRETLRTFPKRINSAQSKILANRFRFDKKNLRREKFLRSKNKGVLGGAEGFPPLSCRRFAAILPGASSDLCYFSFWRCGASPPILVHLFKRDELKGDDHGGDIVVTGVGAGSVDKLRRYFGERDLFLCQLSDFGCYFRE